MNDCICGYLIKSVEAILAMFHLFQLTRCHYNDVIMSVMASQITGVSIVLSTVCPGADQRRHQSSASLDFVRGIHRWPMDSPHKGPVTRKMSPFDDVIMCPRSLGIDVWCARLTFCPPSHSYKYREESEQDEGGEPHWRVPINCV